MLEPGSLSEELFFRLIGTLMAALVCGAVMGEHAVRSAMAVGTFIQVGWVAAVRLVPKWKS